MQSISFSKLNGQGNDFIIIDASEKDFELSGELIASMCDRHFGIGADGLIFVRKSESADFFMDYYNHDGSVAEMCGNGIRCMARFIMDNGLWSRNTVKIDTRSGIRSIEMDLNEKTGGKGSIKVNMGKPVFEPCRIPVNAEPDSVDSTGFLGNYPLTVRGKRIKINCISMGNPHCVVFIDDEEDLDNYPVGVFGPEIENNSIFPNKTNVEFVEFMDMNEISLRVWERGVGETLACGTGACASVVCSIMLGKVKKPEIKVNLPGGDLDIYWDGNNSEVVLKGTVEHVFEGEYIIR